MKPPRPTLLLAALLLPATPSVGVGRDCPAEWEDGPASWEEFGHDNEPAVCGVPVLTVEEWEAGRYWVGGKPFIVANVTDGWPALRNWKKQEMLRRYPDAEATMGEARLLGEYGPDIAGEVLTPTTVKEFVTEHMYDPSKYFFDRSISIPRGMLEDCRPLPMPSRAFADNAARDAVWRDHFTISIGADLQGLTFHDHGSAWNVVIFGAKRWILWNPARWRSLGVKRLLRMKQADDGDHPPAHEWIRTLYPRDGRLGEIRRHGHDCVVRAGDMMFVPGAWMHMVVNVGDTVAVVSEAGKDGGKGRDSEDYLFDPTDQKAMRGIGLVNRLVKAGDRDSGRRNLLERHLVRRGAVGVGPDGETTDPGEAAAGALVEALSNAAALIRKFEAAGTTDRRTAAANLEELRRIAVEAREVLIERFGDGSDVVEEFTRGLTPVFRSR